MTIWIKGLLIFASYAVIFGAGHIVGLTDALNIIKSCKESEGENDS